MLEAGDSIYTGLKGMIELYNPAIDEEQREQKIIELKVQGYKSKEVAQMLGYGESMVDNFLIKYNKMVA